MDDEHVLLAQMNTRELAATYAERVYEVADWPVCTRRMLRARVVLPCGHVLCTACVLRIFETSPFVLLEALHAAGERTHWAEMRCPLCRAKCHALLSCCDNNNNDDDHR